MEGLLLVATKNIISYVVVGVMVLLLVVFFIMMNARNKKETQKVQEQTNSLKVGDEVLTTSGVYGKITEIKFDDARKIVVIETGGKTKSYLSFDAYAIYEVVKSGKEAPAEQPKVEETKPETKNEEAEKPAQKKTANRASTTKKNTTKKK